MTNRNQTIRRSDKHGLTSTMKSDYQGSARLFEHYLAMASAVLRDSEPRTGMDVRSVAVYDLANALEISHEASADWYEIAEHWINDAIENAERATMSEGGN